MMLRHKYVYMNSMKHEYGYIYLVTGTTGSAASNVVRPGRPLLPLQSSECSVLAVDLLRPRVSLHSSVLAGPGVHHGRLILSVVSVGPDPLVRGSVGVVSRRRCPSPCPPRTSGRLHPVCGSALHRVFAVLPSACWVSGCCAVGLRVVVGSLR